MIDFWDQTHDKPARCQVEKCKLSRQKFANRYITKKCWENNIAQIWFYSFVLLTSFYCINNFIFMEWMTCTKLYRCALIPSESIITFSNTKNAVQYLSDLRYIFRYNVTSFHHNGNSLFGLDQPWQLNCISYIFFFKTIFHIIK